MILECNRVCVKHSTLQVLEYFVNIMNREQAELAFVQHTALTIPYCKQSLPTYEVGSCLTCKTSVLDSWSFPLTLA